MLPRTYPHVPLAPCLSFGAIDALVTEWPPRPSVVRAAGQQLPYTHIGSANRPSRIRVHAVGAPPPYHVMRVEWQTRIAARPRLLYRAVARVAVGSMDGPSSNAPVYKSDDEDEEDDYEPQASSSKVAKARWGQKRT